VRDAWGVGPEKLPFAFARLIARRTRQEIRRWLLRLAIGRSNDGPEVRFGVHVRNDNRDRTPPLVRLKALCGQDDDGAPCLTVMLPEED
jgi:hypothetical protein